MINASLRFTAKSNITDMVQPKSYKRIKVEGKVVGMVGSDVQCSGLNVLPANPSFDSCAPSAWESLMVRLMMIKKWKLQRFRCQEDKNKQSKGAKFLMPLQETNIKFNLINQNFQQ